MAISLTIDPKLIKFKGERFAVDGRYRKSF